MPRQVVSTRGDNRLRCRPRDKKKEVEHPKILAIKHPTTLVMKHPKMLASCNRPVLAPNVWPAALASGLARSLLPDPTHHRVTPLVVVARARTRPSFPHTRERFPRCLHGAESQISALGSQTSAATSFESRAPIPCRPIHRQSQTARGPRVLICTPG